MSSTGFDVLVLTVGRRPDSAAPTLARLFGLSLRDAELLCGALPCTPVRDVPYHHAERLAAQARSAGFEVEVVPHALEGGRATLPEVPGRLTLPELGNVAPAARAHVVAHAPITLRPGAEPSPAVQPTVFAAPALAAAQALAACSPDNDSSSASLEASARALPAPAQKALPARAEAAAAEPWYEAPDVLNAPVPARVLEAPSQPHALGFAAAFGADADLGHALPPRAAEHLTVYPTVDLMRDSSLPFVDPEPPTAHDTAGRKSLGFLLSFPAAARSQRPGPPTHTTLPRTMPATPAWPRVELPARAALPPAASARAASVPSSHLAAVTRSHAPDPHAPAASSEPSKRTFRPADLRFGVNDAGGTGLPRRTVWLLGVLWLSVALLLWSRGLLF